MNIMKRFRAVCVLGILLFLAVAGIFLDQGYTHAATGTAFNPQGSLAPLGILAQGNTTVSYNPTYTTYTFSFFQNNAPVRQYEIETSNPNIQKGLLKVKETITSAYPLVEAGPRYRKLDGVLLTPLQFANQASTIFSH